MARRMRRPRHEAPKVWHNPDLVQGPKRTDERAGDRRKPDGSLQLKDERGDTGPEPKANRVVARAAAPLEPKAAERERLIARLLAAEGRIAISRACNELLGSDHQLPDDQSLYLQVLEHNDEGRVAWAIERLTDILSREPCKRHAVLDSRLRRLEELADETVTRDAAQRLRRQIHGRSAEATPIPSAVESTRRSAASTDDDDGDVDEAS
jgi:hypothetical protein